ncbi:hypothetical protein [Candidatus Hecatella orcuttiae]|jgi:hypothetical protein|uniref:hypothetical protein n=1 Tax=Candidatus Hecatella orcuttiae TaxID=1935119 RepID=UPI002867CB5B|nr:hypothetical protein [Candidatus Hecatella orcuttiae]
MSEIKRRVQGINMLVCVLVSVVISWIFYTLALQMPGRFAQYTKIDVLAGVGFVFILSMIISFSLIPAFMEKLSATLKIK